MIKELKDFLFKGNVLDLAVAVVMGSCLQRYHHFTCK